jgi:hypothetical protein
MINQNKENHLKHYSLNMEKTLNNQITYMD